MKKVCPDCKAITTYTAESLSGAPVYFCDNCGVGAPRYMWDMAPVVVPEGMVWVLKSGSNPAFWYFYAPGTRPGWDDVRCAVSWEIRERMKAEYAAEGLEIVGEAE